MSECRVNAFVIGLPPPLYTFMTREIVDPPHPTPNPDGPHTQGKNHEAAPVPAGPPAEEEAALEEPYDSFFDDVNKKLSESIEQPAPDPALGPESAEGGLVKQSRPDDPLARLMRGQKRSPRTSEVFKAVVALSAGSSEPPPAGAEVPRTLLEGDSPDPEAVVVSKSDAPLLSDLVVEPRQPEPESTRDDESPDEARFPWFQVFLLSYASAITLALSWILLTGRAIREVERPTNDSVASNDPAPPQKSSAPPVDATALPLVPNENVTRIGTPIRIGDLQVTPLSVVLTRVELAGAIDPSKYRIDDSESLVMRLQLTNLSKTHRLNPLELAYIRDQASPLDRCLITTSRGATIATFPLAADSEWSIVGQETRVLECGETLETIIASEPGVSRRIAPEMTWRVRLRIGPFRTDVVGIRFRDSDVEHDTRERGIDPR